MGVSLGLDDVNRTDEEGHSWEKEGKLSRAACWLVFTDQRARAMEVLMRSEGRGLFVLFSSQC